jgi:hypothetical protein
MRVRQFNTAPAAAAAAVDHTEQVAPAVVLVANMVFIIQTAAHRVVGTRLVTVVQD